ncbi:MAG TPA: hypothetical protein VMV94_05030 [Phycisphaerae bacterium]|nr:hypothetical protein [Phycisphaerae bacterium]
MKTVAVIVAIVAIIGLILLYGRMRQSTPRNRIEETVDHVTNAEPGHVATEDFEAALSKFNPEKLSNSEQESWYFYRAAAAFDRGDRGTTLNRAREGTAHFPNSARLHYMLGQEYAWRGQAEEMVEQFRQCSFPEVSSRHILAAARYCYLWDKHEAGLRVLDPVIQRYYELRIADDTFVHLRGLPFVDETLSYALVFHLLSGHADRAKALLREAESRLNECSLKSLQAQVEYAFSTGLSPCIANAKNELAARSEVNAGQLPQATLPVGDVLLQIAILEGQQSEDVAEVERRLDAVQFTERDFPWLGDMRLLAKCELAHRAGDLDREAELMTAFLQRQQLLFEPNHALRFHLLSYQEIAKKRFRAMALERSS